MDKALKPVIKELSAQYGAELIDFRDQQSLLLAPEHLNGLAQNLKSKHGFEMLSAVSAVDYWPEEKPRFHVVYQFLSLAKNIRLEIRVPLPGDDIAIESLAAIYPAANWFERELWDMFGIHVNNHPDLRRILMPADWEGHPLRKDYPLDYEEVQFSFNFEEIEMRKPRPKD